MQTRKRQELKSVIQPIIADGLLQYRTANGLSQEAMAKKLKISVRTYVDLEHNRTLASATTLMFYMSLLTDEELKSLLHTLRSAIEK